MLEEVIHIIFNYIFKIEKTKPGPKYFSLIHY